MGLPKVMPVCVIGCGRRHCRDNEIGLRVAERLAGNPPPQTSIRTSQSPGMDLIADLEGVRLLVVTDVAQATPNLPLGHATRVDYRGATGNGSSLRLTPPDAEPADPARLVGVSDALKLGRDLNILPDDVWIYMVAGRDFSYGEEVSPGLDHAVGLVAEQIRSDVASWLERQESQRA